MHLCQLRCLSTSTELDWIHANEFPRNCCRVSERLSRRNCDNVFQYNSASHSKRIRHQTAIGFDDPATTTQPALSASTLDRGKTISKRDRTRPSRVQGQSWLLQTQSPDGRQSDDRFSESSETQLSSKRSNHCRASKIVKMDINWMRQFLAGDVFQIKSASQKRRRHAQIPQNNSSPTAMKQSDCR